MPGPFDTTTRFLVQSYPSDWLAFVGLAVSGPVEVIDANLTTVTAEVDKVVRVGAGAPMLVHLEFQSSYDPTMGQRLVRYSTLLHLQHQLPVASVLLLLRPEADGAAATGEYGVRLPDGRPYLWFSYDVRRIWLESPSDLVAGPLGTLPLAPLSATTPEALPGVLRAIEERLSREATTAEAAQLRVVTYTLLGLRYPTELADRLMPGIRQMRDSATYQAILEDGRVEGRAEGERRLLLLIGTSRLGLPTDAIRARIEAIDDVNALEGFAARLLTVSSWDELLAGRG